MSKYITKSTALCIVKIRTNRNLTQDTFAELCGITKQTVAAWENGRNTISAKTLTKLSKKLKKSEIIDIFKAIEMDKSMRKSSKIG